MNGNIRDDFLSENFFFSIIVRFLLQ